MIGASTDQQQQEQLIEKYMQLPNQVWDDIINQASKNVDVLKDHEAVKQLGSILKTNVRACKALGHPYVLQLGRIYLDMLNVYICLLSYFSNTFLHHTTYKQSNTPILWCGQWLPSKNK